MADAIAVLNAGSSSLKFSLFADARRRARARRARPGRRALHVAALRREGRATGRCSTRSRGARARRSAMTARSTTSSRSCARELAEHRLVGVGHRVVHGGLDYARRCASTRHGRRRSRSYVPLAPLHQPHNLAPIRLLLERAARPAAGRVLRHRVPPRAAAGRAGVRAAASDHRARRAPLRLPRPVVRVHRAGAAARSTRTRPRGQDRRAAPRQRREHVRDGGRAQRREHDGLHRGRRPADGHALRQPRSRA